MNGYRYFIAGHILNNISGVSGISGTCFNSEIETDFEIVCSEHIIKIQIELNKLDLSEHINTCIQYWKLFKKIELLEITKSNIAKNGFIEVIDFRINV